MLLKLGTAYNLIKNETPIQVFSLEFCEIFHNSFLVEHLVIASAVIN